VLIPSFYSWHIRVGVDRFGHHKAASTGKAGAGTSTRQQESMWGTTTKMKTLPRSELVVLPPGAGNLCRKKT
jgi:hypothetical protein